MKRLTETEKRRRAFARIMKRVVKKMRAEAVRRRSTSATEKK